MNRLTHLCYLLVLSFFSQISTWAQSPDYYAYTKVDSSNAYWKLRATSIDQTPTVQFYNARHQLLYQEMLPLEARHLDQATRRTLDRLLTNLVNHRLLTNTYLSQQPEALPYPGLVASSGLALRQVVFKKGTAVLWVEPSIDPFGKLRVSCAQSSDRLRLITIEDADHGAVYEKCFKSSMYTCNLNLTQLPSGQYYVKIGGQGHPVVYQLLIDQSAQQYVLQSQNAVLTQ